MPRDRRALRNSFAAQRNVGQSRGSVLGDIAAFAPLSNRARDEATTKRRHLLGFDFDCTLTVRHFYKVFAWGYAQGSANAHCHCEAFFHWCHARGFDTSMEEMLEMGDPMCSALEDFCRQAGEDAFRDVFREVFLGGDERISLVGRWLERLQRQGVEFAIVTAGTATAVLRGLAATPEWLPYFPSNRVWDTSQGRHSARSVMDQKVLMLRDISPEACRILLVDDSLEKDPAEAWVLLAASVEVFEGLDYEGTGVTEVVLEELEKQLFR